MAEIEYRLTDIVRDPGMWIYEASELSVDGHYYLYRYDAEQGIFSKATVPAGAAGIHFRPVKAEDKVPVGGWHRLERKSFPAFRPRLVAGRPSSSA